MSISSTVYVVRAFLANYPGRPVYHVLGLSALLGLIFAAVLGSLNPWWGNVSFGAYCLFSVSVLLLYKPRDKLDFVLLLVPLLSIMWFAVTIVFLFFSHKGIFQFGVLISFLGMYHLLSDSWSFTTWNLIPQNEKN